jgi:hypothetical protein
MARKKRRERRERAWPEPIPDTPQNVARILMGVPTVRPEDEDEPPMVLSVILDDEEEQPGDRRPEVGKE